MFNGWRGTDGDIEPVPFECEVWGYPNRTTTLEPMYDNTHFKTIGEAWKSIRRSWEAGMSLTTNAIKQKELELINLKNTLATLSIKQQESLDKWREWLDCRRE